MSGVIELTERVLRIMQSSSCFALDRDGGKPLVCGSLPCACAASLAESLITGVGEITDVSEISGFTPGPWTSTGLEVRDADGPICVLSVVRNLGDGTRRASSEVYASAALIAAAPDMHAEIARLRREKEALEAEVQRLTTGLMFYYEKRNWKGDAIANDGGEMARSTLRGEGARALRSANDTKGEPM